MGVAPPRGGRERGSEGGNRRCASTVHAHRTNPHPKSTGWSHRATGGASHPATPRRGNPPGSSAGRRRNAADDGMERTRAARGLRSVRKKPSPGARAIGESEERQEGSGCGDAEPATDEEQTFEGPGAREPPAHAPRWTHRKVWSTNDRRRINPANPRSGASCNMLEAGVRRHRRGGRNHEDGPRRKMASTCRSEGHATPAETRAETPRAGWNEPGETRKRGPKKDEKFQERKDESPSDRGRRPADPARTPETPQRVRRWIGIERLRAAPRHESPRGGRRRRRTTRWAGGKDQRPTREPGEAGNCATSSPSERQGWEDETRKGTPSSPTGSSANL